MRTLLKIGFTISFFLSLTSLHIFLTINRQRDIVGFPNEFSFKLPEGHSYILPRFQFSKQVDDHHLTSGAILTADPVLVANGGKVTVSWSHVSSPSLQKPYDWVGLYCPSTADPQAYLDYSFVDESPTYTLGYGSVHFTLYNLRTDCEFRYYRNDTYNALMAVSNTVNFKGGRSAPLQGHLALTGNPTQMRVSWTTGTPTLPMVFYGLSADNLLHSSSGVSKTYSLSELCGPPANDSVYFIDPGFMHDVLLTNLQPKTTYFYKFGSNGVYSEVKTFTTAVAPGDSTPFTFIAYGDMGKTASPGANTTVQLVLDEIQNGAAFVMNQGDLSYALGFAMKWDVWMSFIEPCASLAPYMISIGNHEYDHLVGGAKDPSHAPGEGFHPKWGNYGYDSGGECGVPTFYRFHMPDTGNSIWWYSYDYGLAHFTVFSTEHNFTAGAPLHQWLEHDLKSVDREKTPWLIAVGHRSMYSSEKYPADYELILGMQRALEDMFYEHQVDLAVWGHYHAYERTCSVYKNKCDSKGTVHIVVGSAGFPLDNVGTYGFPWSLHFEPQFGYLRVSVANQSALHLEYIRNVDRVVADQVWLHN